MIDFATGDGSNDYKGRIDYTHSDNRMSFGTNGISGRVNIDSNGYLGIGTTSPTHLLTVGQGISETGGTTSMAILAPGKMLMLYCILERIIPRPGYPKQL